MKLRLWQVDAFAARPLQGNPAAVVPLERWLDTELMQAIAGENNLAETAFFVKTGAGRYDLRWFTPTAEVDLCGSRHAGQRLGDLQLPGRRGGRIAVCDPLRRAGGHAQARWPQCHVTSIRRVRTFHATR